MKSSTRFLPWVFVLVCLFLTLSCAGDDESSDDDLSPLDALIAKGKYLITQNDGMGAHEAFKAALTIDPTNVDAKYGIVLTGPMILVNFVDQIIGTIKSITFDKDYDPNKQEAAYTIENAVHEYLYDYVGEQMELAEVYYYELSSMEGVKFSIDSYVLEAADTELLNFSGDFDNTDLQFVGAMNSLGLGAFHLLLGLDMRFDPKLLGFDLGGEEMTTLETIEMIVGLVDDLLTSETYPTFLALAEEYGEYFMNQAGMDFGNAFTRINLTLDSLAAETEDPFSGPITFFDIDKNGHYNEAKDPLIIGDSYHLEPRLVTTVRALSEKLAPIFYEGSELDEYPYEVQYLSLATFNELLIYLEVLPIKIGPIKINQLPEFLKIDVGGFFSNPDPEGIRPILFFVLDLWDWVSGYLPDA